MATAKWEKRNLALEIPVWDSKICIQCNQCALVCPHAAIRAKVYDESALAGAPPTFKSTLFKGNEHKGKHFTIQVAPEDCTGCNLCVNVCPAKDRTNPKHKAIDMHPQAPLRERRARQLRLLPRSPRARSNRRSTRIDHKSSQFLEPLFEYSGACAGCGETPYLKLLTQLFGDRLLIANATGCSSIYGGNLPTTPYTTNRDGRGPAWSNSLFEDNAEFGFGFRLALDAHVARRARPRPAPRAADRRRPGRRRSSTRISRARPASRRSASGSSRCGSQLAGAADRRGAPARNARRLPREEERVAGRRRRLGVRHRLRRARSRAGEPARRQHPRAWTPRCTRTPAARQSKATPLGAAAKFAAAGKPVGKKDLGLLANMYGHVYVAKVAFGAKMAQTAQAFLEAESYHGPSLIIAYSHCIAHGYDMAQRRGAAEAGRRLRRLAALPLRSAAARQGRAAAAPRLRPAEGEGRRLPAQRVALPDGRARRSRPLQDVRRGVAGGRRAPLCRLSAARGDHRAGDSDARRTSRRSLTPRRSDGPQHDLSRDAPAPSADRRRRTARRRSRHASRRSKTPAPRMLVLRSLYEEEITGEQMDAFFNVESHSESFAEAGSFAPEPELALGPDEYLEHLRLIKSAVAHSRDGVAQRRHARRLDLLRAAARGGRRGRPRAAHLSRRQRHDARARPTSNGRPSRSCAR